MANDLNQCQFIGRLGRDPEARFMPSGDAISGFSIAVGSQWKDKNGDKQEATEWVNITAFGKLAEICNQYLKKGSQVFISGRMRTEKYQKDGIDRYSTKVVADRMQMLGSSQGRAESGDGADSGRSDRPAAQPGGGAGQGGFNDFEDDIPW